MLTWPSSVGCPTVTNGPCPNPSPIRPAPPAPPPAPPTPPLKPYTGPLPPWPYVGFKTFPAHFFGANASGQENAAELALIAKHQFAGWGWQQDENASPDADDGHFYNEETALAQAASRFGAFVEFGPLPKKTQAVFVYRHSQMALSWFDLQRAAYNNSANDAFWKHGPDGKVCFDNGRGGPTWNFSHPAAADYWIDEVIGDLVRQAPSINSVFFDETDAEYCGGGNGCGGMCGGVDPHCDQAQLYRDKMTVLRRTAQKLNAAGIWPMFSATNSFGRQCAGVDYSEYYNTLSDVGWFRFYEFFDFNSLENYARVSACARAWRGLCCVNDVHVPRMLTRG
jgi:hypothetical protein